MHSCRPHIHHIYMSYRLPHQSKKIVIGARGMTPRVKRACEWIASDVWKSLESVMNRHGIGRTHKTRKVNEKCKVAQIWWQHCEDFPEQRLTNSGVLAKLDPWSVYFIIINIIKCMCSRCRRDDIHVCFAYASSQSIPHMYNHK